LVEGWNDKKALKSQELNTLGAEGFFIISVASAGISAIFTQFQLKN
jgi:hypothetical protein